METRKQWSSYKVERDIAQENHLLSDTVLKRIKKINRYLDEFVHSGQSLDVMQLIGVIHKSIEKPVELSEVNDIIACITRVENFDVTRYLKEFSGDERYGKGRNVYSKLEIGTPALLCLASYTVRIALLLTLALKFPEASENMYNMSSVKTKKHIVHG